MNFPHSCHMQIFHIFYDDLPGCIRFFMAALDLMPELWNDMNCVQARFDRQGPQGFLSKGSLFKACICGANKFLRRISCWLQILV